MTCNGYANYETFTVALFLNNNRPQYDECIALARAVLRDRREAPAVYLADSLKVLVVDRSLYMDSRELRCKGEGDYLAHTLLSAAVDRVNWKEIAEEWLTTAQEATG